MLCVWFMWLLCCVQGAELPLAPPCKAEGSNFTTSNLGLGLPLGSTMKPGAVGLDGGCSNMETVLEVIVKEVIFFLSVEASATCVLAYFLSQLSTVCVFV